MFEKVLLLKRCECIKHAFHMNEMMTLNIKKRQCTYTCNLLLTNIMIPGNRVVLLNLYMT